MKILLAEDDFVTRKFMTSFLSKYGECDVTVDGMEAVDAFMMALEDGEPYDLVCLDIMMPVMDGMECCRHIKEEISTSHIPVLMLTARDTEMDEIQALETGADDYMSKPFSLAVLKTRIKKQLKRKDAEFIRFSNGFYIDRSTCRVLRGDREISLSTVEYRLLTYLIDNKGRIVSKEQILAHVWDSEGRFVDENAVSVNIRRLRQKIEDDPDEPVFIRNIRGMGYIWKEI